jgi:hypothetical protein
MSTIHESKRREVLDTPLLLFECTLADGTVERWSTHRVTAEGNQYEPRVLKHGGFEMKLAGEEAVDTGARFTVTLSNVDRHFSQVDGTVGWKAAKLRVRFGFFDLQAGTPTTELCAVFAGIANPAEELTETEARLSFTNRLNLQRLQVPALRIQNRCPWRFPETAEERAEAVDGGARGCYSALYRCGYSADQPGGTGNLEAGTVFLTCGRTREDCQARGMLRQDAQGRATARFGGFAYLPPSVVVRAHGEKSGATADPVDGRARANDAVPLVYGTAWITAPVIFARNDGNLTHCEVLLGSGPIERVQKVIANGVELPPGEEGRDMTATGWYNVLSTGERNGGFNLTFTDEAGNPAGDPHGSMAVLAVVLPNAIVQQGRLPKVEVLLDGMKLARYDAAGEALGESFTRNPAWVLLDLLRRGGWEMPEINVGSFAAAAAVCDEFIPIRTPGGQEAPGPRFEVNLALTQRRSLSEVVRGLRTAAALMITVDESGRLMVTPETTLERQCAVKPAGTNSTQTLNGGWPAYEFGDGMNGFSGILRRADGASTFRIWRRASSETANRLSVEFQDAFNQYQQDSLSLVDFADAAAQGCEVAGASGALGLPHVDQAARILRLQIEKSLRGNRYIEFETSVQALGLRPGDLIAISHSREGLDRTPFRVLKLAPALNYERARIVAQIHEDNWYEQASGDWQDGTRQSEAGGGVPRPLAGPALDADGRETYEMSELSGGAEWIELSVKYAPPGKPSVRAAAPPVVSLSPVIQSGGGNLSGGQTLYYAVSSVDEQGVESGLSYTVHAGLPGGTEAYAVTLEGIRCAKGSAGMRVYRGRTPGLLRRIAEVTPAANLFTDAGLAEGHQPPPDANFDHARFQWRMELMPETAADQYGAAMIGRTGLGMQTDEYAGAVVRILRGAGQGQERVIRSNTADQLLVAEPWGIAPNATSWFAIAEAGWKPAGITPTEEIRMLVPNRPHEVVQVLGVAVSAAGAESASQEAMVGRHVILGSSAGGDADVPGMPAFGLSTPGQGSLEIGGIGFATLENTNTIRTGTLTVHYWDEMKSPNQHTLGTAMDAVGQELWMAAAYPAAVGDLLQIEGELVRVLEARADGVSFLVDRGCHDTVAQAHGAGTAVYLLERRTMVMAFVRNFFGSPASGSYGQRFELPNARVGAAEFYVTNDRGNSPTAGQAYTMTSGGGLRTMAGGQYSLQFEGELTVAASIAPPLVVETSRVVRDVQAQLGVAPLGEPVAVRLLMNDLPYADLTIPAGSRVSNSVTGFGKAPLPEGGKLTAAVLSVGTAGGSYPGRDLTITVRL